MRREGARSRCGASAPGEGRGHSPLWCARVARLHRPARGRARACGRARGRTGSRPGRERRGAPSWRLPFRDAGAHDREPRTQVRLVPGHDRALPRNDRAALAAVWQNAPADSAHLVPLIADSRAVDDRVLLQAVLGAAQRVSAPRPIRYAALSAWGLGGTRRSQGYPRANCPDAGRQRAVQPIPVVVRASGRHRALIQDAAAVLAPLVRPHARRDRRRRVRPRVAAHVWPSASSSTSAGCAPDTP